MASRKLEVVIVGDSSSLQRALGKAESSTKRFGSGVGGHLKSLAKFAAASAGIAGVGLAFSKTASLTVDFDKSMRNVNSIAQLSEGRFKSLSKQVLDLAGKTGQAPKTLADGLYDLVSSGFNAKQSMTILQSSAKAATAGLTTTETSTKAVAAVLNAYHRPASDAANVSDALFQTVNRGVISFEDLASNIGDVLPFASALHVNLNQVGAAVSTMTKEGISAPETMTRIKNVMQSFIKPSKGMAAAIKETGASSGESLIKQKGFQGAIEALIKTTDGSKASVAKLFPNIRALGGALALTGGNAKTAHKDLAAFRDVTGATDTALKQQSKSVSFQWNKIKATISSLAIQLGSKLIPAISTAIQWLGKFVAQMKAGTGVPGQIRNAVVSAFGAVKSAVTGAVTAVKNIVRGFKDGKVWAVALVAAFAGFAAAATAFKVLSAAEKGLAAAQLAVNAAMDANPIVLIGAAVIGLGVALVVVYNKCKVFRTVVNAVWGGVKAAAVAAFGIIKKAASVGLLGPIGLIVTHWQAAKSALSTAFNAVKSAAVTAFGIIKKAASVGLLGPIGLIVTHWQAAKGVLSGVFGALKGAFKKFVDVFLGGVSSFLHGLGAMADGASHLPGIGGKFKGIADKINAAGDSVDHLRDKINGLHGKTITVKLVTDIITKHSGALPHVKGHHTTHIVGAASVDTPSGIPSLAALDADASARVAGLLFPATRKGDLIEAAAGQAVTSRHRELAGAVNRAQDAAKAKPHSKALKADLDQAKRELRDFDAASKTYLSMAHGKTVGLQNIQKFKDAIAGLRDKMHGLASDAAAAFRKTRESQIASGPEAKELAGLQATDKAQQDATTTAQLAQDLADAKASGDVKAQQSAQDAIDAYARQKREDELSASIQAQTDGLDAEEANYQGSLDARLQMLVGNLDAGKETYKQYVSEVQSILGPLNIAFTGDPSEEEVITPAAPGKPAARKKPKPKRKKRASGGDVSVYHVGELGPEDVVFSSGGARVAQASQSRGRSGDVIINMPGARVGSMKAARVFGNKLAHRMAFS